jgi:hypothetical protein
MKRRGSESESVLCLPVWWAEQSGMFGLHAAAANGLRVDERGYGDGFAAVSELSERAILSHGHAGRRLFGRDWRIAAGNGTEL